MRSKKSDLKTKVETKEVDFFIFYQERQKKSNFKVNKKEMKA